jgi:hypothetical protein
MIRACLICLGKLLFFRSGSISLKNKINRADITLEVSTIFFVNF